jgi:hypothetical protein
MLDGREKKQRKKKTVPQRKILHKHLYTKKTQNFLFFGLFR